MSRLIDADALPNELFKKHVHDCEELEPMLYFEDAVKVVENAPTIDAIPVEWLREFDLYYAGISGGSPYMKALIEAWQKEQEAR